MSELETKKSKKSKKNKKSKKKPEQETEVLERVMDSIEMAGASLDFFEEETESNELDAALAEGEEQHSDVESPSQEESLEATSAEEEVSPALEMDENTENMEMLAEENEADFIDQTQALSIIESLLFSSDRPLGLGTFKQVFKGTNYKTKEIKKALEEMQSVYAESTRGVELEEINGGWQLRTKVDNMDFLRKLAKARPFRLSGPALEVLAIIAYKQPLVKSEVDDIRGVESGHLVRALMEKHLVCFQGKSELPGKPMQYGTTRKFLEIFGLRNLRELPSLDEIDQLLPDGIGIEEEDEKLSDVTAKMSEEYGGNYSEGEEELVKIQSTLEGIDTSSEFFEEEKRRQKEKRDRDRAQDIREALDVGEEVESKDQRWLARYEEKQAAQAQATEEAQAMDTETGDASGQEIQESKAVGVEALQVAASMISETETETLDELIAAPEEGLSDELSALSENSLVEPEVMAQDENLEKEDQLEAGEVANDMSSDSQEESVSEEEFDNIEGAETFDPFKD